jgi:predicted amidophosphoribosyltransferase
VLVVDDVVTTGSTLRSAEAALRRAGARSVQRAAVATTPALVDERPMPLRRAAA